MSWPFTLPTSVPGDLVDFVLKQNGLEQAPNRTAF